MMIRNERPSTADNFTRIVFAVVTTLIGVGVVGLWSMSNSISRLDERVAAFSKSFESVVADIRELAARTNEVDIATRTNAQKLEIVDRDLRQHMQQHPR